MSIRVARILIVGAACLMGLSACSTAPKLNDETASAAAPKDGGVTGILSDLWPSKKDKTASVDGGDTTGSVLTQPAEPGPSGEPVTPLSHPGLAGDDPNDDVQLGKKYFRSNNFGLAEKSFRSAVEKHPNDAGAWVGLAAANDRLHRFDLADRAYAAALRLVGPTAEILNDQGFSYMLRGDYARAHKKLEEARAKDPANPYVQANLQLLEESYRNGKAIQ
ncbi:MAG TPA: tetratricopeptide repeat protein [Xanthobacteraceae bacterium]|jgi:tetratricopeptide (TPR) repeat protein|nr:tetratricopeptide repeat protein [Xanthobacteraceae bacterium]